VAKFVNLDSQTDQEVMRAMDGRDREIRRLVG
jgi:hypothetical protein